MASNMYLESASTPSAIRSQLSQNEDAYRELGEYLRANPPSFVATVARGSSGHACNYGAYMITARLWVPATSLPPSAVTLYQAPLIMDKSLAIGVSQSGKSPDIVATLKACASAGAKTAAFVNTADSPLALLADVACPLHAGPEHSVAATKSFVASMSALARLVGHWEQDRHLLDSLRALPETLELAQKAELDKFVELFFGKNRALVLGRGPSWSIALEAALKFKETCSLQAEALTAAEVKHGPKALVEPGYPILMFAPRGPAQNSAMETAAEMRASGAEVFLIATADAEGVDLPLPQAGDPWLDPLVMVQVFHLAAERLARARGRNPDAPPHLNKVTMTV